MTKRPPTTKTGRRTPLRGALFTVPIIVAVLLPTGYLGAGAAQAGVARRAQPARRADAPVPFATGTETNVTSNLENPTTLIARDAGQSVVLPDGHELWLTGDTQIYFLQNGQWVPDTASGGFTTGTTAMQGKVPAPGQRPTAAEYPNTGQVTRFIPAPTNVYMPNNGGTGKLCTPANGAAYAARWPTGAIVRNDDTDLVLITYTDVCVVNAGNSTAEGWGYMYWNWTNHTIFSGPTDVWAPSSNGAELPGKIQHMGHPVLAPFGQPTLMSGACTGGAFCPGGRTFYTILNDWTQATLNNQASYTWTQMSNNVSGTTFKSLNGAISVFTIGAPNNTSSLRMLMQNASDFTGGWTLYSATALGGVWHQDKTGSGTTALTGCNPEPPAGFCRALEGHWELNTATDIIPSYFDPGAIHLVTSDIHI